MTFQLFYFVRQVRKSKCKKQNDYLHSKTSFNGSQETISKLPNMFAFEKVSQTLKFKLFLYVLVLVFSFCRSYVSL